MEHFWNARRVTQRKYGVSYSYESDSIQAFYGTQGSLSQNVISSIVGVRHKPNGVVGKHMQPKTENKFFGDHKLAGDSLANSSALQHIHAPSY